MAAAPGLAQRCVHAAVGNPANQVGLARRPVLGCGGVAWVAESVWLESPGENWA